MKRSPPLFSPDVWNVHDALLGGKDMVKLISASSPPYNQGGWGLVRHFLTVHILNIDVCYINVLKEHIPTY